MWTVDSTTFVTQRAPGCSSRAVPLSVVGSVLGWSPATTIRMSKYGHIGDDAGVRAVDYSPANRSTTPAPQSAAPGAAPNSRRAKRCPERCHLGEAVDFIAQQLDCNRVKIRVVEARTYDIPANPEPEILDAIARNDADGLAASSSISVTWSPSPT